MLNKTLNATKNLFLVIIGSLLLSFATSFFYLPYNIVSGGISGLAIVLSNLIKVNISFINEEFYITIFTWAFFILGIFTLGKRFALQTLCATIVYPIGVYLFSFLYSNGSIFHLDINNLSHLILAALFGGAITGLGVGLTFLGGGSTGGVDIPTLIIYKLFKIRVGVSSFIIDTLVIIFGIFVIKKFDLALIGILAAFVTAFAMDKIFIGGKASYIAYIVSEKYEEINNFIIEKMERGSTLLLSQGGYSKKNIKVIQVCFDVKEYYILKNAIVEIDPKAFVTIVKAHEIRGMGFSYDENEINDLIKKSEENE